MISCVISDVNEMINVSVYGHSGERGESLICAGASTLFGTLSVSVEEISEYICESGYGFLVFPKTDRNLVMTKMFRNGLEMISRAYPGEIVFP